MAVLAPAGARAFRAAMADLTPAYGARGAHAPLSLLVQAILRGPVVLLMRKDGRPIVPELVMIGTEFDSHPRVSRVHDTLAIARPR